MSTTSTAIRNVVLVSNPQKMTAVKEKPRLISWLKRHKIGILPRVRLRRADAVLTLGGDGTILSIASEAAQAGVPVLGINTGRLGFMTGLELKNLYPSLDKWLKGRWVATPRMMLEVRTSRIKRPMLVLNDAVVRIGSLTRVTRILARINNEDLAYFVGDGVIVATSTGSTAYSLSAQGPIVHPDLDAILLTPICAHSFTQRPVVFPADQQLVLKLDDARGRRDVQLSLDGQRGFPLKTGDEVHVRRSQYKLELLHDPETSYFGLLREKLLWGE